MYAMHCNALTEKEKRRPEIPRNTRNKKKHKQTKKKNKKRKSENANERKKEKEMNRKSVTGCVVNKTADRLAPPSSQLGLIGQFFLLNLPHQRLSVFLIPS